MSRIPNPTDLALLPDLAVEIAAATGRTCPYTYGGPDTKVRFTHARPERHKNFYL
jgi:hypothetical protein